MKKYLFLGLFIFLSQVLYSQNNDFIREEVKPSGSPELINFLEIANQEAAGLLPPQHSWKPKKFKHPKPNKIFPMPNGYVSPNIEEITAPLPNNVQAPSPNPNLTFLAISDINTSIPPDVNGAVGPNHVMTTLNTQVAIRNKTGALIGSLVSLDNFFGGGFNVFDPKILYDPYNSRWIFTACANAELGTSSLLVAVSANNDPTGTWYKYSYDVDATDTYWFDYPSIGFNKDWVAISGNMFPNAAGSYNGTKTYVLKKSDLYANAVTPASYTFTATPATAFTLVPSITYDNTLDKIYVMEEWNSGTGNLRMLQITGVPPAAPAMTFTNLYPTGSAYGDNTGVADAPQSGIANKISTNDSRVQMVIYRNGSLWVTHTVFLPTAAPTRSAVQWWQIDPTSISNTGCVQQVGRVDDATGVNFFAFPSIAVNANNDVMVGFSRFSGSQFASANYAMRYSSDPLSTMRDNIVFKAGEASYFKDFGAGNNRWGDYTATTIDPTNDLDFWTLQEYAAIPSGGFDRWGTYWAKLCITPTQPGAFTVSSATVCQGQNTVVYTVPVVAGATSYTWTYSGTGATFTSTTNTVSINFSANATSGNLNVTANNSCGPGAAQTIAITVNPLPAQPGAFTVSSATVCQGQNAVVYTVPVVAGATSYTWTYSGTGATFTSTTNTVSINFSASATAGTLSGVANNSCGPSLARTLAITVNPLPTQPGAFTVSSATVCQGQNAVVYTVPVVGGATSYTWTYSGTGATFTSTTNSVSINYSGIATSGTLSVVANNSCGPSLARTLAITVNTLTAQPGAFTVSSVTVCQGQNAVVYTVPVVGGATSYTWTYSGTGATFASTTNSVSINFSASATGGNLSVVANSSCGPSLARTLTITVNTFTTQPGAFTLSSATVCQGQNAVVYTVPVVVGATSYTWTYTGTGATFASTTNSVSINYSSTATAGTLSVVANNSCGPSLARTLAITVNPLPTQPGAFTVSSATVCQGQNTVIYTVPIVSGATTYTWTYTGTGATFASTTNSVSINYSGIATSGTLSVVANNSCGPGMARTLAITVNSIPSQPAAFTVSSVTVCQGQNAVVYTVPVVVGATSYTWSYSGTGATFASTTNSVSINFSASATAGTLSVVANNSCGPSLARTLAITVNSVAAQPANFTASAAYVCFNQTGVIYTVAPVAGATSYTWTYSGTGATFASTTNSVSINFSGTATSGTLSVVANNSCGPGTALTLAISVNLLRETLKTGNWNDVTVWSCGSVPLITQLVRINSGHIITIPASYDAYAKSVTLIGNIIFGTNGKLNLSN
jgi:PKD-like domain